MLFRRLKDILMKVYIIPLFQSWEEQGQSICRLCALYCTLSNKRDVTRSADFK